MYTFAPDYQWWAGMGDAASDAKLVSTAIGTGGSIATGALAASGGLILGMAPALAIPVIANSGCGVTCVETSQWANQAEDLLKQNIATYFSQPTRTASMQAAALETFDKIWGQLGQYCGQPGTGDAGKRCISDRQAGACTWRQTSSSPLLQYPGEPQAGECWSWFSGYRDPIANDPGVVPDSVTTDAASLVSSTGSALQSVGVSSNLAAPLLIGAAIFTLWAVLK